MQSHSFISIDTFPIKLTAKSTVFSLPIQEDSSYSALLDLCEPAKFGLGKEHIHDPNYRKAGSLTTENFSVNFDPYQHDKLLKKIAALFAKPNFCLKREKLNVYPPGGLFKAHRDTPRPNLLGTLVVCLPSCFCGGELRIEEDIVKFEPNSLSCAVFFSEREHEVLPVTSGTRITISYGIYTLPEFKADNISKEMFDFLHLDKKYSKLAYGCQNMSVKENCLKGEDLILFNWLEHNGLNPQIKTILDEDNLDQIFICDDLCKKLQSIAPKDWEEDPIFYEEYIVCSDPADCRTHVSYNGDGADDQPTPDDYEFIADCKVIKKSNVSRMHLSLKACYGNEPYKDDAFYHYYCIVFDNPALKRKKQTKSEKRKLDCEHQANKKRKITE